MSPTDGERPSASPAPAPAPAPMSDRRFLTVLVGALAAVVGIGLVVLALLGLRDPLHRDFDTGVVRDTSRVLLGTATFGAVLTVVGAGAAVALVRLHLRDRR